MISTTLWVSIGPAVCLELVMTFIRYGKADARLQDDR